QEWFAQSFAAPTPAQMAAWEAIERGDDTLVVAPTGSGKTLAAFLSAIDRLALPRPADGPTDRAAQAPPGSPPRRAGTPLPCRAPPTDRPIGRPRLRRARRPGGRAHACCTCHR